MIISNVDIMTKWVKASIRTSRTFCRVQKTTTLYCNAALKPGKDNTYAITQYNIIQKLKCYIVLYHLNNILLIYI